MRLNLPSKSQVISRNISGDTYSGTCQYEDVKTSARNHSNPNGIFIGVGKVMQLSDLLNLFSCLHSRKQTASKTAISSDIKNVLNKEDGVLNSRTTNRTLGLSNFDY